MSGSTRLLRWSMTRIERSTFGHQLSLGSAGRTTAMQLLRSCDGRSEIYGPWHEAATGSPGNSTHAMTGVEGAAVVLLGCRLASPVNLR